MDTIWDILKVNENASVQEIRAAYSAAAQKCHPEERPEEFAGLQKAYKEAMKHARQGQRQESGDVKPAEIEETGDAASDSRTEPSTPLMDRLKEQEEEEHAAAGNTPAMQQFKTIFMDGERRDNREEWRAFFLSDTFLEEQYEEAFVEAMHEFLSNQQITPFTLLPDGLVIELAIVYVLKPERETAKVIIKEDPSPSNLYEWKEMDRFQELAADIWNSQQHFRENDKSLESKTSFVRRKSYGEYRTIRKITLDHSWDYRLNDSSMEEYKFTLSMAHWEFLADDDKINSMDLDDEEIRVEDDITHACLVELFDYLLRRYGFPVEVCSYMYKYFELEDMEQTDHAEVYTNLKAHILEQYPDMNEYYKSNITAGDYENDVRHTLKDLNEKYAALGWGKNFVHIYQPCYADEVVEWCQEEAEQVYALVKSSLFQKYKYSEPVVGQLIVGVMTVTQAKILYEIYDDPDVYMENRRVMRLLHELFGRIHVFGMQEQYLTSGTYVYDLTTASYDFWEYFLTTAFGDRFMGIKSSQESPIASGFLYGKQMMLPAYMQRTFVPSVEWRLRFTNYDKVTGRFGEPRRQCYQLTEELELVIEFHYHYIRYFLNGEEVLFPAFDAESLFAYAGGEGGEAIFLLLLPITYIQPEQAQRVFDHLMQFLPGLVQFPVSALLIANMIANDNASIYQMEGLKSRHYIENLTDCYRLDRDMEGHKRLYHLHPKYGCWEYYGEEMIGRHFRDTLMEEPDAEGWDMETFQESDLSLPYEVETKVHEFSGFKTKEKVVRLLKLFEEKHRETEGEDSHFLRDNKVILVFGDKNRMPLRQHFSTGVLLTKEMKEKAFEEHRFLEMQLKQLIKFAKEELEWTGWIWLENFHGAIPVGMGKSGTCYAHGVPYGKGKKAKDFAALFHRMICLDELTQVIEYRIEDRSEWDCAREYGRIQL